MDKCSPVNLDIWQLMDVLFLKTRKCKLENGSIWTEANTSISIQDTAVTQTHSTWGNAIVCAVECNNTWHTIGNIQVFSMFRCKITFSNTYTYILPLGVVSSADVWVSDLLVIAQVVCLCLVYLVYVYNTWHAVGNIHFLYNFSLCPGAKELSPTHTPIDLHPI